MLCWREQAVFGIQLFLQAKFKFHEAIKEAASRDGNEARIGATILDGVFLAIDFDELSHRLSASIFSAS